MEKISQKAIWIAKATAHFDTPAIRKEALKMYSKRNSKLSSRKAKEDIVIN